MAYHLAGKRLACPFAQSAEMLTAAYELLGAA